ncbi:MAG TPA: OFA family MFS transporter [Candidatus Aphodousia gallistercoris]|nr:OFA family MFS transporter [Candidatus Aphodousia gallistercoris]
MQPLTYHPVLEKKRWLILLLASLVNICAGANYAWSVFAQPLAEHLQAQASELAFAFSLASCCSPVSMLIGGYLGDRFGPRYVLVAGGLLMGLALIGCSMATTATAIILIYGVVFGFGMGVTFAANVGNLLKFFPDRSGLAGGLSIGAYGASSVIIPFLAVYLISGEGVEAAFRTLGVIFIVIVVGCALFMSRCPEGFVPAGYVPKKAVDGHIVSLTTWQMVKTRRFWAMMGLGFCGALAGMMVISHAAMIGQYQMHYAPAVCAMVVSVVALGNMGGRFIAGVLSDYIGRIQSLLLALLLNLLGAVLLWGCAEGDDGLFMIAVICIGLAFGAFMSVYPSLTTEEFGPAHNSANYGLLVAGFSSAAMLGPIVMTFFYSLHETFSFAYLVSFGVTLIGFVFAWLFRWAERIECS